MMKMVVMKTMHPPLGLALTPPPPLGPVHGGGGGGSFLKTRTSREGTTGTLTEPSWHSPPPYCIPDPQMKSSRGSASCT